MTYGRLLKLNIKNPYNYSLTFFSHNLITVTRGEKLQKHVRSNLHDNQSHRFITHIYRS